MNIAASTHAQSASSDTTPTSGNKLPSASGLNNMFLQLLVAQLEHQSPLNPMDPAQFVGQLAQFSELSEITQIDQLLQEVLHPSSDTEGTDSPGSESTTPHTHSSAVPANLISSAVDAAQAANSATPASVPNHPIQGVF
jgi:flagellar hook assembly protein FlgD